MKPKTTTGILFVAVFLDLLGFGMVLPLMPLYAADPRFAATPAEIGWLMAIYSIMQFICAPYWGQLSDRIGRRPTLLLGLVGSALSYLAYGLANALWILFVARAAAGMMGANIAVAQAALADLHPPRERSKAMGLIGAAFGLGFVIGPAFGGWLAGFGVAAAPLVAALITGLNALAAFHYLPETRQPTRSDPFSASADSPPRSGHPLLSANPWRLAQRFPGAWISSLIMGAFITLFSAFEVTLPLWGKDDRHWDMTTTGWIFTFVGVIAVITQGGLVRRLMPRIGEKWAAMTGLLLVAAGLFTLRADDWPLLLGALALISVGSGLIHPSLSGLTSLNTDPAFQGSMLGVFQSMSALGRCVGPVLGGAAYDTLQGGIFALTATGIAGVLAGLFLLRHRMRDLRAPSGPTPSPDAP
ncbi:MAG: MFS transporter [Magnetococcales bacterium]|nr:MFS transporter [Magnetococcales bacterium]